MKLDAFNQKEEYSDGTYRVLTFTGDRENFKRISCQKEAICLLPFDVNEDGKIKNVYLAKYHDYVLDGQHHRCVTTSLEPDEFETYHDSLISCIDRELGINDVEVNDLYYLGQVRHTVPFTKNYKCYAINVTNYSEDPTGFTPRLSDPTDRLHSIDKVRFSRVINGEIHDSLVLSSAMLLISYVSD